MRVLRAVVDYREHHGYPPTMRELQAATGIANVSQVAYWLNKLQRAGLVMKSACQARTVVVTARGVQVVNAVQP